MKLSRAAAGLLAAVSTLACTRAPAAASAISPARISQTGTASWYGPTFNGKPTTSGETYDQNAFTAAHRTFPLGTRVRVTGVDEEALVLDVAPVAEG